MNLLTTTSESRRRAVGLTAIEIQSGPTPTLSLAEVLELAVEQAMNGASVRDVAFDLFDRLGADDLRGLALTGFMRRINDSLGLLRHPEPESVEVPLFAPPARAMPHRAARGWRELLASNYQSATPGVRKALLDFTVADAHFLARKGEGQVRSWRCITEAMDLAADMLVEHNAATIADLPTDHQQQIAEVLR